MVDGQPPMINLDKVTVNSGSAARNVSLRDTLTYL